MFLLEGEKLVKEAIRDKPDIIKYFVVKNTSDFDTDLPVPIYSVNERVFNSLSQLSSPPDVIAVCEFLPPVSSVSLDLKEKFTFYLDNINDPGNLGAIIRVCDWFGINPLICSPNTVDLYNSKTINASKGSFLRVNVLYKEFEQLSIDSLTHIYVTDIHGKDISTITNKNGLIILGNEAHGVSTHLKKKYTEIISIPKHPSSKAESLNVAMSASIVAFYFSNKQ